MARRLRITHVIVQPVVVWDDGDDLEPGPPLNPKPVPLSALPTLREQLLDQLAEMQPPDEAPDEAPTK